MSPNNTPSAVGASGFLGTEFSGMLDAAPIMPGAASISGDPVIISIAMVTGLPGNPPASSSGSMN